MTNETSNDTTEEMDRIRCEYYAVSGSTWNDCVFLGMRYDELTGFRSNRGECWILRNEPEGEDGAGFWTERGSSTLLTGIWRSPKRAVFVSGAALLYNSDMAAPGAENAWQQHDVFAGMAFMGVWGLSDDCVFTWGTEWEGPNRLFRFNGKQWRETPAPGFRITALHGIAPDCLTAVGEFGEAARFHANRWQIFPTPVRERLTSVFMVSADQIYAVGAGGSVLEGSSAGWGKIAEGPKLPTGDGAALRAVAWWQGELWIGGGVTGLWKRVGKTNRLESVNKNITAVDFDSREELLIAEEYRITSTRDGVEFNSGAFHALEQQRDGKALMEW